MLSLAVLVLSLMLTACHGATFGSRNHFRRHRPRGHRFRVGREKLDEVASTTTTVAPNVERYDLTSYGDNGVQQYEEPAIGYGAPGPEDDINDGYAGDVPGVGVNVGVSGNTQLDGAAADSFEASDKVNDEGDGNEYDDDVESVGRNDAIPPWCDPTNPMGAWLNYQKIQDWCLSAGFTNLSPYAGASGRAGDVQEQRSDVADSEYQYEEEGSGSQFYEEY